MGYGMIGGMLLFWIILIVLAFLVVRGLFQASRAGENSQPLTARQILEKRYARGEINQEQFQQMLKDIQ